MKIQVKVITEDGSSEVSSVTIHKDLLSRPPDGLMAKTIAKAVAAKAENFVFQLYRSRG